MKPIELDENGCIIMNDLMSDELKEKIALYNDMVNSVDPEEEIEPEDDGDDFLDDDMDIESDGETVFTGADDSDEIINNTQNTVNSEDIQGLNDLFS